MNWLAHWLTWQFSLTNAAFGLLLAAVVALLIMRSARESFNQRVRQVTTEVVSQCSADAVRWESLDARLATIDEQLTDLSVRVGRLQGRQNIRISVRPPGRPENSADVLETNS